MLSCPSCGLAYTTEGIDPTLGVAHCEGCGTVSELVSRVRPEDKPVVPMPSSPRWHDEGPDALCLTHRWMQGSALFILFFTVVWCGGIGVMLVGMVASEGLLAAIPMLAIPHVWVGAALAYYSLAVVLNTTVIVVEDGHLEVIHGPVPWWGQRTLPVDDIDQLYVELSGVRVNKQPRWNLSVMDRSGMGQVLVRLLPSIDEARWLEDRIERALGVEDRQVAGEVDK